MAGYNYKELMSEKQFLQVQRRAQQLGGTSIEDIEWNDKLVTFTTNGLTGIWTQKMRVMDIDYRTIWSLDYEGIRRLLINSDLKVYCDCPAFLYWGYKYIATQKGYGLRQEGRPPVIRNENEKGFVCKHLYSVMLVWPYLVNNRIAKLLKQEAEYRAGLRGWIKESNFSMQEEFEQTYLQQFNQQSQKLK